MSDTNEGGSPEEWSPIKIRPRDLPASPAKKKRGKKKAAIKPEGVVSQVVEIAQDAPKNGFPSNVERAQFLLKKKRRSKKLSPYAFRTSIQKESKSEDEVETIGDPVVPKKTALFRRALQRIIRRQPFLLPTLGVSLLVVFICSWIFYQMGVDAGNMEAEQAARKQGMELPADVAKDLDQALMDLRLGDSERGLKRISEIERSTPWFSSLSYLTALAAIQNGQTEFAAKKAQESILKRERISDSLALEAVIATQREPSPLTNISDPRIEAEALLRQAIIADAANPYPHFELANLLRYKGRKEEAIKEIKAAQARLNPIDSHLVMDITLAILTMEDAAIPNLPPLLSKPSDDVRKLFPAAYAAMRRGDFDNAAAYLRICRENLSPDIFDYIINDRALRRFIWEPKLAEFYPH
ncbi:MAG: hypothetical protein ABI615_12140 [Chthoniobacterales bacterium]